MKGQTINIGMGLMGFYGTYKSGAYDEKSAMEAISTLGFKSKSELDKQMAFAKKSEECLKKLSNANSNSRDPVRYYGDSSELMIHVKGSKVQLYTSSGMVEIDGTNCKSVDGSKNVVDGLISIAKSAVRFNTVGVGETQKMKESQSKRIVDMLQSCGQVDSKFEDFSRKTLKESYKTSLQDTTIEETTPVKLKNNMENYQKTNEEPKR